MILVPLKKEEWEDFIIRNQNAFALPFIEKFGEIDEDVIPIEDILSSLEHENAKSFNIMHDNKVIGGVVLQIDEATNHNSLDLLFLDHEYHNLGLGYEVWKTVERQYPNTLMWETHTPYFDVRNIHFYVNKCGFSIVEFYNAKHPEEGRQNSTEEELFFRFEKKMK